jgi:hypothetical protein
MNKLSKIAIFFVLPSVFVTGLFINSCQKTSIKINDAVTIVNAYNEYRKTPTEESLATIRSFEPKYALASAISASIDVSKKDYLHRDQILLQALKTQPDSELYMTLSSNSVVFSEKNRIIEKEKISKIEKESIKNNMLDQFKTTLAKSDLEKLDKCYNLLDAEYGSTASIAEFLSGERQGIDLVMQYGKIIYQDAFGYSYSCRDV